MNVEALAYSVLFPVVTELEVGDEILRFLDHGGQAVLFGEYGEEYLSGCLDPRRATRETPEIWRKSLSKLRQRSGHLLAAADADVSAVNRFSFAAPSLPSSEEFQAMGEEAFAHCIFQFAQCIPSLGINMVLSPTADVVVGPNAWLAGRTLGTDIDFVSNRVGTYVAAMKNAGVQSAIKHYPGHPTMIGTPASVDASVDLAIEELRPYFAPFLAGFTGGAEAVLLSPVSYPGIDLSAPAPLSKKIHTMLRDDHGFDGLTITCDLDHKSTQGQKPLGGVAVSALNAGSDLLLVSPAAISQIPQVVAEIGLAVNDGSLEIERLIQASDSVREAAQR